MAQRLVVLFAIIGLAQCKLLELSCDQIHQFVDGHNSRRLQVANGKVHGQPSAEKMKSLIWDEELASKAADWASQNPSDHNPDISVASGKYETGENLYWSMTTNKEDKLDVDGALESWFAEHENFTFAAIEESHFSSSAPPIGHYTQMVWSDTTHLGCAISQNQDGDWNKFALVCNYGPGGNMLGETPYKTGQGDGKLVCGAEDCEHPYGQC